MTLTLPTPTSINGLLERAYALEHLSIQQLSEQLNVPYINKKNKGWVGQLLELALGADAKHYAGPDFQHLKIELKTIPLQNNHPLESTYLTTLPLGQHFTVDWETSVVYQKIKKVLWIPLFVTNKKTPLHHRIIGKAVLWEPSLQQLEQLRIDWEEFLDRILLGELDQITAHMGTYLQIRPKANNALATCWTITAQGNKIQTLPRGFYLRPILTQQIFNHTQNPST